MPSSVPRAVLRGLWLLQRRRPQQGEYWLAVGSHLWLRTGPSTAGAATLGSRACRPLARALLAPARETVSHAVPSAPHVTKAVTFASKALQPGARTSQAAGVGLGPGVGAPPGVCVLRGFRALSLGSFSKMEVVAPSHRAPGSKTRV